MRPKASVRLLSPPGIGGIAVIEVAGPGAGEILASGFRCKSLQGTFLSGTLYYGHIVSGDEVLDEVIVACLQSPPGEPVFEVNCHGGSVAAKEILSLLTRLGAEESQGGETLFGRELPRLEREVLAQLIDARTQRAAEVFLVQLNGALRRELESIRALLSSGSAGEASRRVRALLDTARYGRRLAEPATVVVTGAPNVGKSTLANALVGRERSIVHHLPGTTRDAVHSVASLDGLPVVLVDTAGLREATDEIERLGVKVALDRIRSCDLVVWVFDHSRALTAEESAHIASFRGLQLLGVINKIDLEGPANGLELAELPGPLVRTCALTGRGIGELRKRIFAALAGDSVPPRDAAVVTTSEVAQALSRAAENPPAEAQAIIQALLE